MLLHLIRHGETDWNREGRYQGWRDIPLNERGREQARALSRRLDGVRFQAVYASPLSRAMETAGLVTGRDPRALAGLREINHGEWEGLLKDEVAARWPRESALWARSPHEVTMPGGESLEDVRARALAALGSIRGPGPVLVCAHDATNRCLLAHWLGAGLAGFARLAQVPTALNVIELGETGPVVRLLNGQAHLPAALRGPVHRAV